MNTTVCDVTIQFTFFLVVKLKITIITSCDSLILIRVPCSVIIKAWKWTEDTRQKRRFRDTLNLFEEAQIKAFY